MEKENILWTTIISPKSKFLNLNIKELLKYRDLVFLFVKRDFVIQYKQTILGPLWYIIQPLISTLLFTFVFGNLAKLSTDNIPYVLFYYSGTMAWSFFEKIFKDASDTFVVNADLFNKVYFPRLTVPISKVFINFLSFLIQLLFLVLLYLYYVLYLNQQIKPSIFIIFLPLLLIWLCALALGLGLIITSITTKYRDLKQLISFGINLWMYATPIVYPLSQVPFQYKYLYYINPVSAPIELFRVLLFQKGFVPFNMIITSITFSILSLFIGLLIFNHNERNFIDLV